MARLMLPKLGADYLKLPNLDRLCAEGVTFRNHFTQAVPCGPARASLLTGQYLMNHRAVQNTIPLSSRFTNLAHELRRGGYDPALVGYTTTTPDPRHTAPNDPRFFVLGDIMEGFHSVGAFENRDAYFGWVASQGFEMPKTREDIWLPKGAPGAGATAGRPSFRRNFRTRPGSPSVGSTICAAGAASLGSCISVLPAASAVHRARAYNSMYRPRTCRSRCARRRRRKRAGRTRCSTTMCAT